MRYIVLTSKANWSFLVNEEDIHGIVFAEHSGGSSIFVNRWSTRKTGSRMEIHEFFVKESPQEIADKLNQSVDVSVIMKSAVDFIKANPGLFSPLGQPSMNPLSDVLEHNRTLVLGKRPKRSKH